MKISLKVINELKSVKWFSKCESPLEANIGQISQMNSWKEAEASCGDSSWINKTEDAQGQLTEYLSSKHPRDYQGVWNKLVQEATKHMNETVVPVIENFALEKGLGNDFVEAVKWDVLHAIMEESYASKNPPNFFRDLLEIYKSGHFPCGIDESGGVIVL